MLIQVRVYAFGGIVSTDLLCGDYRDATAAGKACRLEKQQRRQQTGQR